MWYLSRETCLTLSELDWPICGFCCFWQAWQAYAPVHHIAPLVIGMITPSSSSNFRVVKRFDNDTLIQLSLTAFHIRLAARLKNNEINPWILLLVDYLSRLMSLKWDSLSPDILENLGQIIFRQLHVFCILLFSSIMLSTT